ncbi:MAG: CRISPR-associated helicase Cas3' [Deltaproteobacteria bacterium]|nr:CRISPR-associated helicase Cas3' [Deltaproteobacteria bacterium]MBW2075395.1 CRISPR-associated helicase Cas3' [Deltaproteobacteria bacterium]
MTSKYYAHSIEGKPPTDWQLLDKHLENVSELAAGFANEFNAQEWARIAGRFHDIGKGSLEWQAYLRYVNGIMDEFSKYYTGRIEHSIHGAKWLYTNSKEAGKLLAYCIAGHHGGLPNWVEDEVSSLSARIEKELPESRYIPVPPEYEKELPFKVDEPDRFGFQLQFFVRMIFSCLVDADFLDTEKLLTPELWEYRGPYPPLEKISRTFRISLDNLRKSTLPTRVNNLRETVLHDCLSKAEEKESLFSLTVPTGGGKTLSSMAFALEHAKVFKKKRVIYVVPFTTVIEQNAHVFRSFLEDDAVLEHHCNFYPEDTDWRTKLATENWDAPIILTTNVQFFDSFFSNKPSRCRRLHNVANSVVIFDEIQTIPVERLKACTEVIKELTLNYNVTAVLCTATQPALDYTEEFGSGLKRPIVEIVSDVQGLFNALKRTEIENIGTVTPCELVEKISAHRQSLCIVNTRAQALDIYNDLPYKKEATHLSALMYPAHRSRKIKGIKHRLLEGLPCRVVSTQLIEAGVDVDFPVVFRMSAGMDSIAQAAGRCNREGRLDSGKVFLFRFEDDYAEGFFRQTRQSAEPLFEKYRDRILEPECIREYFLDYYWKNQDNMDEGGIIQKCNEAVTGDIQFKDIAIFQMIKTTTVSVIVAVEPEAVSLVERLKFSGHSTQLYRKLQQFTVQIYPFQFEEIRNWVEHPFQGINVLRSDELYSDETGLLCKPPEGVAFFG